VTSRWWRAETAIFLVLWTYWMVVGPSQLLLDPGPFWSTVIGQHILQSGRVPHEEEFSCSMPGRPWNSHQWLAQMIMALVHGISKLDSLILAAATLLAALYTWAASRLMRSGLHWSVAALLLWLTILTSRWHFHVRPHLATIILLGWTFARLVDFESRKITFSGLIWLVPVFVLWTNLHGGALGGLATVTLVVFGWCFAWVLKRESPVQNGGQLMALLILLACCWLATLVNPYGWQLPRDWILLMRSDVLPQFIVEHQAFNPENPYQWPALMLALVYLGFLVNVRPARMRITWWIPLIWFVLTIQRFRHCALFGIVTIVAIADILPHTRLAAWSMKEGSWLFKWPAAAKALSWRTRWSVYAIPVAVVFFSLSAQAIGIHLPVVGRDAVRLPPMWPVELLPMLRSYEKAHPNAPIFNDMAYGGFLIYYTPQLRLFIDDRCELYGDPFLLDYFLTLRDHPTGFERWQEKYRFQLALIQKDPDGYPGLEHYLNSRPDEWTRIAETEGELPLLNGAVLYERKNAAATIEAVPDK